MNRTLKLFPYVTAALLSLLHTATALAELSLVPTYHSISVYWKPDGVTISDPPQRARVTYWKTGSPAQEGHDLWFDQRTAAPPGTG
ncbi:MAG TPA: hypothetical protein VFZ81_13385, partial [Burkholderiales bacterium]